MTDEQLHERDDDALRELGKQLPVDRPDPSRREVVRASILAAATVPAAAPSRRWLLVGSGFAAGALAAAAIVLVVVRPGAETTSSTAAAPAHEAYAQIESSSAAELEHTMVPTATGTDERVRVRAGSVHLAVPPTRTGDRVRVITGDAEIEGSGSYEVVVAADALAAVTVTSGTATVRLAHAQPVFLAAGQTWRASVETADLSPEKNGSDPISASAPAPEAATGAAAKKGSDPFSARVTDRGSPIESDPAPARDPAPRPGVIAPRSEQTAPSPRRPAPRATDRGTPIETELEPVPSRAPRAAVTAPPAEPPPPAQSISTGSAAPAVATPANETERHFRAGWSLLRASKLADAIVELAAAADAADGPLAADARYYEAVALIRAKRGAEAERALVQFLDNAPQSTRRGRAAIMLGRLIADRGDRAGARAWFEVAAKDPDPSVAAAGAAALNP